MFGEVPMYGVKETKTDDKGRIFLPKFTCVTPGDKLVLTKPLDEIHIYSLEYIDSIIRDLEDKIDSKENVYEKNELRTKLDEYLEYILDTIEVDKYKRINMGNYLEDSKKYKVIGARTHIKIKCL